MDSTPTRKMISFGDHFLSLNTYITYFPSYTQLNYENTNIPIIYTGMKKHQIKSCYYYIFWGVATKSVVIGQIYVGSGYRQMVETIEEISEKIN